MLSWMSRASLELIGQGGLGYSFDPLIEDIPNPLGDAIKALPWANCSTSSILLTHAYPWNALLYSATLWKVPYFRQFSPHLTRIFPESFLRWALRMVPGEGVQQLSSIIDILQTQAREIFYSKKAALGSGDEALLQQVGEGKDLMSVLRRSLHRSYAWRPLQTLEHT